MTFLSDTITTHCTDYVSHILKYAGVGTFLIMKPKIDIVFIRFNESDLDLLKPIPHVTHFDLKPLGHVWACFRFIDLLLLTNILHHETSDHRNQSIRK